jgi:aminoglycoside phosphotransferase family enzyme
MTKDQINKLILQADLFGQLSPSTLIETHISWVVFSEHFAFKIKRPIAYSFLDFSTVEKRKYYCEREIELNKRLSGDMYLDVQEVREVEGEFCIGGNRGEIVDYAVRMRRIDSSKQMDILLSKNEVTLNNIRLLADKLAGFHKNAPILYQIDYLDVQKKFQDIAGERPFLEQESGKGIGDIIGHSLEVSNTFIQRHSHNLASRLKSGFFRDCHGDLHSKNIFLLPQPTPFDCIEFNDELRQIDVLNEIAFLCMDLDSFGRQDLSALFISCYNELFPVILSNEDNMLFIYYKSYRSNIRSKVNSLRAKTAKDETQKKNALSESVKYLELMNGYINLL